MDDGLSSVVKYDSVDSEDWWIWIGYICTITYIKSKAWDFGV